MTLRTRSITRNLVATVLLLELLAAAALIGAITIREHRMQLKSFDTGLLAAAQSLMSAIQESESDDVALDIHSARLGKAAIFRVQDERGRVLGSLGTVPQLEKQAASEPVFQQETVDTRRYRFVTLHGVRIIDPGMPGGGFRHEITIVYGEPAKRIWHAVFEAVWFAAVATLLLLGITAAAMIWMLRRELSPIHELAREAGLVTSNDWLFQAPESARSMVELQPLVVALEEAMARLEASFQQQRRFTSDAAHELKTELAIVKSSLQLLSMRQRSVEEYKQGLARGLDDFARIESTVQKMLTLSRLEQTDCSRRASARCSLLSVLEDAVTQSRAFAELKMVGFDLHSEGGDAYVAIDRDDAMLLCANILSNAVQHSADRATVWIRLEQKGKTICLTVRDEGAGIREEDQPHLFEPFYRGDSSRSRKSGGTGLGLSICRAICQRASGSIEIANAAEGGAEVTVLLPAVMMDDALPSASLKAD